MNAFLVILFLIGVLSINCVVGVHKSDKTTEIQVLVRQAARWSAASQQDESPLVALLHANYGAGYLWALKDIATDQEIHESTGIDVLEFKQSITDVQDEATKQVSKACPQFVGDINRYLLKLSGDI